MPNPAAVAEVGRALRAARLARNEQLEEIAAELRIRPDYLEALEEGAFDRLPGRVYALGYARCYARQLELDEDAVVDRLAALTGRVVPALVLEAKASDPQRRHAKRRLMMTLAAIALLVMVVYAGQWLPSTADRLPDEPRLTAATTALPEAPIADEPGSDHVIAVSSPTAAPQEKERTARGVVPEVAGPASADELGKTDDRRTVAGPPLAGRPQPETLGRTIEAITARETSEPITFPERGNFAEESPSRVAGAEQTTRSEPLLAMDDGSEPVRPPIAARPTPEDETSDTAQAAAGVETELLAEAPLEEIGEEFGAGEREASSSTLPSLGPASSSGQLGSGDGSFVILLASVRNPADAEGEWRRLARLYPSLGGLEPRPPQRVEVLGKGTFYRVIGGAFTTREEASELCERLRAEGAGYCKAIVLGS